MCCLRSQDEMQHFDSCLSTHFCRFQHLKVQKILIARTNLRSALTSEAPLPGQLPSWKKKKRMKKAKSQRDLDLADPGGVSDPVEGAPVGGPGVE